MVRINRKAWLLFDLIGLAFIVTGTVIYLELLVSMDPWIGTALFLMGVFFAVQGMAFGYLEGISVREELAERLRDRGTEEALAAADDTAGYIIDLTEIERESEADYRRIEEELIDIVSREK
ncbi:MAG: hypothetical protein GXX87_03160 [Euryarchaeota archaeon]|jgi:hypothetical protein|nr:hypothetical protein [Euryarchaeota archaeon]